MNERVRNDDRPIVWRDVKRGVIVIVVVVVILGLTFGGLVWLTISERQQEIHFIVNVTPLQTSQEGYSYQLIGNITIWDMNSTCVNCVQRIFYYPSGSSFLGGYDYRPWPDPVMGHMYEITFASGRYSDSTYFRFRTDNDYRWFLTEHFLIELRVIRGII